MTIALFLSYLMVVVLGQLPEGRLQPDDVAVEILVLDGQDEEGTGRQFAGRAEARGPLRGRHVLRGREGALVLDEHHGQFGTASCFPIGKRIYRKTRRFFVRIYRPGWL